MKMDFEKTDEEKVDAGIEIDEKDAKALRKAILDCLRFGKKANSIGYYWQVFYWH